MKRLGSDSSNLAKAFFEDWPAVFSQQQYITFLGGIISRFSLVAIGDWTNSNGNAIFFLVVSNKSLVKESLYGSSQVLALYQEERALW